MHLVLYSYPTGEVYVKLPENSQLESIICRQQKLNLILDIKFKEAKLAQEWYNKLCKNTPEITIDNAEVLDKTVTFLDYCNIEVPMHNTRK